MKSVSRGVLNIPYCYEIEVTLLLLSILTKQRLSFVTVMKSGGADTTDVAGTATINWPSIYDNVLENECNILNTLLLLLKLRLKRMWF